MGFDRLAALIVVIVLALPGVAMAGWSRPQSVFVPVRGGTPAVAVNARGDMALAWSASSSSRRTLVTVATRTAGGHVTTRRVYSSATDSVLSVSIVIDGRGQVTVAWASDPPTRRPVSEPVYAAYGPLSGRWAAARVVGHTFSYALPPNGPQLAVSSSGLVLLAWDQQLAHPNRLYAAWRTAGRGFGAAFVVGRTPSVPLGATPAFDVGGTAYLSSGCSGLVLRAPARSRRFSAAVVATPGPAPHQALSFSLSLAGAGQGVASWVDGRCSDDAGAGPTPGPVYVRVLHDGRFGGRLALTAPGAQAYFSHAVAVRSGATVTWNQAPDLGLLSAPISPGGRVGTIQRSRDGRMALAADGGGDVVFGPPPVSALPIARSTFVRPAGGGPDQPAPSRYGLVAVAQPLGRAVAFVEATNTPAGQPGRWTFSVWRP